MRTIAILFFLSGSARAVDLRPPVVNASSSLTISSLTVTNLTQTNNLIVQSTATVQGNAFSVGGSTMVVRDGSLTMAGPNGNITSGSSITASAFYGNGSALTGVGEANTYTSSKTFLSNVDIQAGSTLTVSGNAFRVGGSTLVVVGGWVGIGTTQPRGGLDVLNMVYISSNMIVAGNTVSLASITAVGDHIALGGVTAAGNSPYVLHMKGTNSSLNQFYHQGTAWASYKGYELNTADTAYRMTTSAADQHLEMCTEDNAAQCIHIDDAGLVGIGTSLPTARLTLSAGTSGDGYLPPQYSLVQLKAATPVVVGVEVQGPGPTYDTWVGTATTQAGSWLNKRLQNGPWD